MLKNSAIFSMLLLFVTLLAAAPAAGQAPIGRWTTISDETNEPRSVVEIYEENGLLFARVDSLILRPDEPANPVCEKCPGERKDQPVQGMVILWDMEPDGDAWSGGRILDPEKGKIYRARIWVEEGNLKVRGYLGPFFRTQTWRPFE